MDDSDRYIPGYSHRPGTFTLVLVSTLCSTALTLSALYGLSALGLLPALPAAERCAPLLAVHWAERAAAGSISMSANVIHLGC
jgi:hypothetical protein